MRVTKSKARWWGTLVVVLSLVAAGCSNNGDKGQIEQTLIFGTSGSPSRLDPAQVRELEAGRVIMQIFEPLLRVDERYQLQPGLAQSWQASPDGRAWTFRLQPGVRFHDGTPFNAQAVCTNFERWYHFRGIQQSFAIALSWRDVFGGFAHRDDPTAPTESLYRSCEARTEGEVVINLTKPSGRFITAMAAWPFSIASPDALRRYEADKVTGTPSGPVFEGTFGTEHPIGTGPFKFEQLVPNERVVIVRNDDYWGAKAKLDRVIFRPIPDGSARRQALEAGEIHGYDPVDPADLEPLRRAGIDVVEQPPLNVGFIALNQQYPPLDNLKVRQAIAYALNRDAVIKAKYPPGTLAAREFLPPQIPGSAPDVATYSYDPERARRLLAESGVTNPTLEFWLPTGLTTPDLPDPEGTYLAFKADLERVGFTVVTKSMQQPQYFQTAITGGAAMYFVSLSTYPDADWFLGTFFKEPAPPWGFERPDIFRAVQEANEEVDPARRVARYQQASQMVMEFLPGIPLVHVKPAVAYPGYPAPRSG